MATFQGAARRFDRLSKRLPSALGDIIGVLGKEIAVVLVPATPVLTGFARANWRASLNFPPKHPVSFLDPTGAATIARITTVAQGARGTDQLFIVNNAPYIGRLNSGHSHQARAGFIEEAVKIGTRHGLGVLRATGLGL